MAGRTRSIQNCISRQAEPLPVFVRVMPLDKAWSEAFLRMLENPAKE